MNEWKEQYSQWDPEGECYLLNEFHRDDVREVEEEEE